MTIKYEPNAAGISWIALCESITERTQMEEDLFSLYSANTGLSISETKAQAQNAQLSLENQAKQMFWQGVMTMTGAGASVLTTVGTLGIEKYRLSQASQAMNGVETDLSFKEVTPNNSNVNNNNSNLIENTTTNEDDEESSDSMEMESMHSDDEVELNGHNDATIEEEENDDKKAKEKSDALKEAEAKQKQYINQAEWWAQYGNVLSNIVNSFVSQGISNLVQKPYVEAQGINRRDEAIAQGMSAVFNSQSSMLSSALSGADSMAQNSNSTLQAIIRTSTAA